MVIPKLRDHLAQLRMAHVERREQHTVLAEVVTGECGAETMAVEQEVGPGEPSSDSDSLTRRSACRSRSWATDSSRSQATSRFWLRSSMDEKRERGHLDLFRSGASMPDGVRHQHATLLPR